MIDDQPRRVGKRVVLGLYVAIVALTGVLGAVVGWISRGQVDPRLFGVIALPPTPLGTALYGVVTVGALLGVLLVAVHVVSKRTGATER